MNGKREEGRGKSTTLLLLMFSTACGRSESKAPANDGISAEEIVRHVQVLGSDSFAGRAPSSSGEDKTVNYLRDQFTAIGVQPGNGNSFFQDVPLVEITGRPQGTLTINGRRQTSGSRFLYKKEFVAWTRRVVEQVAITSSPLVFVGFGVVAPEYHWNDYAGVDVRGKTVVILVNDPGYEGQDTTLFRGRTMTYYGRWTYKFEEAARQGAEGAFIVHETAGAGYPWEVVENGFSGPQFSLVTEDKNMSRVPVEGWISNATARSVFRQAGFNFDTLKARASRRGFKPVPLDLRASVAVRNSIRRSTSRNVLGLVPGGARKDEIVIYSAHWDHFGVDSSLKGDQIMNGARDNASGVAGLLTLARAFTKLPQPPARSVLFLMLTGEEQGLLGSQYYATHPVYPLKKTAAVINIDELGIFGKTRDITLVGFGSSELDDYAVAAAKAQGRVVRGDPEPEKGMFYRSDHFSFAKQGVPAMDPHAGVDNVEHGEAWGRQQEEKWTAEKYHKPSDQYDASWDLSGAVEDLNLLFNVGLQLANDTKWPDWHAGTEFRAKRDSMMK